jgi:mannose-6-phosphate isomerase-like protein (cupin superfamily)
MAGYTHMNLSEVKDSAPDFGHDEFQEAHFAREDLDAEKTGLAHIKVKPGKRMPFAHKHDEAEEIYVVIAGSGRIKLDDEIVEITELDAIRISPEVARCMEAGPDGLSVLAVGAHHDKDGEVLQNWWID